MHSIASVIHYICQLCSQSTTCVLRAVVDLFTLGRVLIINKLYHIQSSILSLTAINHAVVCGTQVSLAAVDFYRSLQPPHQRDRQNNIRTPIDSTHTPGSKEKKTDGNFIRFLHIDQNRWITISNIHATDTDTVIVYNSLHKGKVSTEDQHQIAS